MKTALQIIFALVILVLGYLLFESIMEPIRFNRDRDVRVEAAIVKLKDIRELQVAYRGVYNQYTGSFDTLITFFKNDSFVIDRPILVTEYNTDEITEREAIRRGLIKVEKTRIAVKDSILTPDYPIENIRFVPYIDNKEFQMAAGEVSTTSGVNVKVFEAFVLFEDLLRGLDEQLIINYTEEREKVTKFPGLKVGSLEEATNNAGNWE
ncbi:MAG: hypothetical protein JXR41_16280 [Bacteroidales bacterium]|nr:hypothetical protein [Bacteroidales bacterium]MBN2764654.1 hypothetical protein [Bacteroidales bacterium]